MSNDLSDTGSALDEQLVAYLDGELDPESSRRIEALLASDAEVRRRLQSLERTWDLLDELDAAPVGGPFTQSTLEMVAVAAHEDVERDRAEAPGRRRRRALTVGGGLLAAAAAGFLAVVFSAPDPNRRLLEDLPVLENFDEYRQIENIEFLRELRDKKLFSTAVPESPDTAAARVEDLPARRQRVEGMGLDEKEQLLRAEDRFVRLNPEEQQGLRRLDEQLQADPNAQQLRAIMRRYDEWLKSLSSFSRAELAEMKPVERVTRIQKEEQRRRGQPSARRQRYGTAAELDERVRGAPREAFSGDPVRTGAEMADRVQRAGAAPRQRVLDDVAPVAGGRFRHACALDDRRGLVAPAGPVEP